ARSARASALFPPRQAHFRLQPCAAERLSFDHSPHRVRHDTRRRRAMLSGSPARAATRVKTVILAAMLFWLGTGPLRLSATDPGLPDAPLQKGMQPKGAAGVYRDKVTPH